MGSIKLIYQNLKMYKLKYDESRIKVNKCRTWSNNMGSTKLINWNSRKHGN